jgi:predicted DNA-binding transcriptional regulator AlpA
MTLKAIMHKNPEKLLDQIEVAEILSVSPKTLEYWRWKKCGGPRYVKLGKLARYRVSDVDSYIEQLVGYNSMDMTIITSDLEQV